MSREAQNYFQTSDSIASGERKLAKSKNTLGSPIKFSSKLLALHNGPNDSVYVAEAAGNVKKLNLSTGEKSTIISAPAPLTSIAVSDKVYAGCWDKHIYASDGSRLAGHTDFVKCLLAVNVDGQNLLISGSADCSIIVWSDGKIVYRLKTPKAVQSLAFDGHLYSSGSDPEIRRWKLSSTSGELVDTLLLNATSVFKLRFMDEDLWTASADKTAQRIVDRRADTVLDHPDFVKDVVVFNGLVATACRDEHVRIWDEGTSKLLHTYEGHYEEVTALAIVDDKLVSASIDGTVRRWSLDRKTFGVEEQVTALTTAEEDAELEALMDD